LTLTDPLTQPPIRPRKPPVKETVALTYDPERNLEPILPKPIKWIEALGRDGEATPNLRRVTWRLRAIRSPACLG
jgi:hypothetical protein